VTAALFVLPLALMVSASFRPPGLAPPEGFPLVPRPFSLDSYRAAFAIVPLARFVANSLFVVAIAVPITVVVTSLAGFAIAASTGRTRRLLIAATVVAMMVPLSATWVPRFVMYRLIGLTDSLWALVTPALAGTSPFYVLIFALAYSRLPKAIFEAAQLDGLSPFAIWRKVAFPLALPATFAVGVLSFAAYWGNLVDPLLYLSDPDKYTVALGLRSLQTLEPQNFPMLLAGSVVAALPPVIAFLIVQRSFFEKTLRAA